MKQQQKGSFIHLPQKYNALSLGINNPAFLAQGDAGGWDFEENFTDDQTTLDARWPQAGTKCKPVAGADNFDWSGLRETTNQAMSYNFSPGVSDTAFVFRVELDIDTLTAGTYSSFFGFGLRSLASSSDSVAVSDSLFGSIKTRGAAPAGPDWYFEGNDGQAWGSPQPNANEFTNKPNAGTDYYEIIRLSATTASMEIFTNSTYTTSLESTGSVTIASTIIDLDYILFQNNNVSATGGTFFGTGDTVRLASGVTVAPS